MKGDSCTGGGHVDDVDGIVINAESLHKLKAYFDDAESEGKGGLAEDEFVSLLAHVLKKRNTTARQELTHLFMKIDANSDGSVDWDEFTNYLLMESQSNDVIDNHHNDLVPANINEPVDNHQHYHKDMIEDVLHLSKSDKYLTCSRDGTFKIWNCKDLSHYRTVRCSGGWIIGSCLLPRSQRIAICNLDLTLNFYDVNTFELVSRFNDDPRTRHHHLTTSKYHQGLRRTQPRTRLRNMPVSICNIPTTAPSDQLAVGDVTGSITIIQFADKWHACDGSVPGCSHETGKYHGVQQTYWPALHTDWITDLKFIPEFDALVTSSLDHTIQFLDLDRRSAPVRKRYLGHNRGVTSFDYSAAYKLMISCGSSRRISVWDPYRCREVNSLSGHTAPVQQVLANDDVNEIISVSVDKTIKIWDCRTYRCIKTIQDIHHYRPEDRISRISYIKQYQYLLTASNHISVYQSLTPTNNIAPTSHDDEICNAIYNSGFQQVVSGDRSGVIKVWDLLTGHLVSQFRPGHGHGRITAMTFDASMRRLITGADDGTLMIWNFSSGACLSTCINNDKLSSRREITCIGFIVDERVPDHSLRLLISSGWDGNLQIWLDGGSRDLHRDGYIQSGGIGRGHTDDVSCMCICTCSIIATGSYDGSIVIWNLDTKQVKKKIDPITPASSIDALVCITSLSLIIACGSNGSIQALDMSTWTRAWASTDASRSYLCCTGHGEEISFGLASGQVHIYHLYRDRSEFVRAWRAHDRALISIEAVGQHEMLVTGSLDRRVLLWTSTGALVGQFSSSSSAKSWNLFDRSTWISSLSDLIQINNTSTTHTHVNNHQHITTSDYDIIIKNKVIHDQSEDEYWKSLKSVRSRLNQKLTRAGMVVVKPEPRTSPAITSSSAAATLTAIQYRIHSRLELAEVEDVPML